MNKDRIQAVLTGFIIIWLVLNTFFVRRDQSIIIGLQKEIIQTQMEIIEDIKSINQDTFHSDE
jgi:hypothetical protein